MEDDKAKGYRLMKLHELEAFKVSTEYSGGPMDMEYIHISPLSEVKTSARKFYLKQTDLVVVVVDLLHSSVVENIEWEPVKSRNNKLFPHLYNITLPYLAVIETVHLPWNEESQDFEFPEWIL